MFRFVRAFAGLTIAGAALAASPAYADAITLDASNIGSSYTLTYNGYSGGTTVNGLTSTTTFSLAAISGNTYTFNYAIANTSGQPVSGSRVSSFGFNTDPNIASATGTGAFSYTTLNSTYPNAVGAIDVCFKDAKTGSCAGGGSGGLTAGQTGSGTFTLTFCQPVTSLMLSDFFVRYQAISGAGAITSASGTGTLTGTSGGTTTTTSGGTTTTTGGTDVPEPGMLGLLSAALLLGAAAHRRRQFRVALARA